MFFNIILFLNIVLLRYGECLENPTKYSAKFYDLANNLANALGIVDDENNTRIQELKEKLSKIESYVIDQNEYAQILMNETVDTSLNNTNFYYALSDNDKFKFLFDKEPKSLYLKLKERMNRDDILNAINENNAKQDFLKSARRMIGADVFGNRNDEALIDEVVDKIIALSPNDTHTFSAKDRYSEYWDPQTELQERYRHHKRDGRRIYRGLRTTVKHYPFMASVHVMGRFWCGGSIYAADLIITSASCLQLMHNNRFYRENPKILEVRFGSNHSRLGGETISALEVFFHPSYNPRTLKNNIAIIRLRRAIRFDYHRVPKKLLISYTTGPLAPNGAILLLGWGVTKISQKLSFEPIFLQRKILPIFPNSFCRETYGDKFIADLMFCAGTFSTGEGACDHDAGGPALLHGKLVGIISFGPAVCGFPNAPTVFTLLGPYADWIETIDENIPEEQRAAARTTTKRIDPVHKFFMTVSPRPVTESPMPGVLEGLVMAETLPQYLMDMTATPKFNTNSNLYANTDINNLTIPDELVPPDWLPEIPPGGFPQAPPEGAPEVAPEVAPEMAPAAPDRLLRYRLQAEHRL